MLAITLITQMSCSNPRLLKSVRVTPKVLSPDFLDGQRSQSRSLVHGTLSPGPAGQTELRVWVEVLFGGLVWTWLHVFTHACVFMLVEVGLHSLLR